MRIIDLDKVRWEEGFYDMHTGEQFAPMMFNTKECLEWATANAKVKAIPIELYEQVKGERDVAIEQLKSLNIELFEKPYLKAISIEWIKNYARHKASKGFTEIDCYWQSWEEDVLKMIEEWEKENETN